MPNVVVYRSQLLHRSETFIRAQVASLTHWHGILVGKRAVKDGLDLHGIDTRILPAPTLLDRSARFLRLGMPSITRTLKAAEPDLVHVHFGTDAVDLWPSLAPLNVPVLVTLHGFDIHTQKSWWHSGKGGRRRRDYPERLIQMSRSPRVRFIAVSESNRQRAIDFGLPSDRILTHYMGVDTRYFHPSSEGREPVVLFLGRLVEKKGAEYLLRAWAQVVTRAHEARLVIAGDGPLRAELEGLATSLGVDATFLGAVTQEEARGLMQKAKVFCLPSITAASGDAEGFPIVLMEAQACGTPVISSARGGADEGLIDGITGFRFPERDVETLARQLTTVLTDETLRTRQSNAAIAFVRERLDLFQQTKLLERLYDQATEVSG